MRTQLPQVIIVGASNCGKTTIALRLRRDNSRSDVTVGPEYTVLTVLPSGRRLHFWDMPGRTDLAANTMVPSFARGAHAVILAFDLTSAASFRALREDWLPAVKRGKALAPDAPLGSDTCLVLLLGTKLDLVQRFDSGQDVLSDEAAPRAVSEADVRALVQAEHIQGGFLETAALHWSIEEPTTPLDAFFNQVLARLPPPRPLPQRSNKKEAERRSECSSSACIIA
jgi:GTPase SAR1 family protein